MIEIEEYLNKKYEFYFNIFSNKTYYKKLNSENSFLPIEDYFLNSVYRELRYEKIKTTINELRTILHSNYVRQRNPFKHFLNSIENYDETIDYIDLISSSVKSHDDNYFRWAFKKWFVGFVACVLNTRIANENVMIFIGGQGIGKTTWLKSLLPRELEEYYYSGEINPNNKDHLALFASKILINLDELTSFSQSKVELFKEILSKNIVTYRRPYGTYNEDIPRIATLVGTSNHKDVLMDTTGNRRYLCIEVNELKKIDEEILIKAYKQAFELYKQDFKHYFTEEEIKRVNSSNTDFMQNNEQTDIITKHFEVCELNDPSVIFMNATELIEFLREKYKVYVKLDVIKIGRLLRSLNFLEKKVYGTKKYALKLKDAKNNENYDSDNLDNWDMTEEELNEYNDFIDIGEYLTIDQIIANDKQNYPPERVKDIVAEMDYDDFVKQNKSKKLRSKKGK